MEKKLYEWQEKCLKRWFTNNGRGMVQAATGAGKTMLALTAVKRLERKLGQELLVRIVVPNGGLMCQWEHALLEFLENETEEERAPVDFRGQIGLCGGGQKASPDHKYMVFVINSARYELARQLLAELREGKKVILIADECHHYGSSQNRLIFEFLPFIEQYKDNYFSLGLSATLPAGQEKTYLESVLGRKIYNYGIAEASRSQTVCRYDVFHIRVNFKKEEWDAYEEISDKMTALYQRIIKLYPALKGMNQKEQFEALGRLSGDKNPRIAEAASGYLMLTYKRKSLVCLAKERIACVCELIKRLDTGEKIIIFGERISQADELYRILQERYPGKAGRYHSKMGQQANKNVLDRFRQGEIRILISCKALDEGVDVPDASVGVILSGTSGHRQRIQRLGRIIRNAEGKEGASLYYLHIEDTSEDSCYLPNVEESSIFELVYQQKTGEFSNAVYDETAGELVERIKLKGADEKTVQEMERCLRMGSVRSDWRRECGWIEAKIEKTEEVRERNYWICMKRIASRQL